MTEQSGIRSITPEPVDIRAFELGLIKDFGLEISEEEIAKFCQRCSFLNENNVCELGSNKQARYASRQWCGWARVMGVRGKMTSQGFQPHSKTE